MCEELIKLKEYLREGINLSMQSSYQRRAAAPAAIPFLAKAQIGLRQFVEKNPGNAEAWRLLSQAEECLLNYGEALSCLEEAVQLSGKSNKKDLKKLVLLRENKLKWAEFPLSPSELTELGKYLEAHINDNQIEQSFRWTKEWLQISGLENVEKILETMEKQGAYSDFQILYNIV